jgi:methanogenic corrinoid protein MtbC1
MTDVIEACRARADTSHVIVMVGGYPFNVAPELLERVRADAYAPDAQAAIEIANQLLDRRMKG